MKGHLLVRRFIHYSRHSANRSCNLIRMTPVGINEDNQRFTVRQVSSMAYPSISIQVGKSGLVNEALQRLIQQPISGVIDDAHKSVRTEEEYKKVAETETEKDSETVTFSEKPNKSPENIFLAERIKRTWSMPGGANSDNTEASPVNNVAVIGGGGAMGSGIVMVLLNAGLNVLSFELTKEREEKSLETIKNLYKTAVKLNKMSEDEVSDCIQRLRTTTQYSHLKHTDLVIEAVFEDMALKKKIFRRLNGSCPLHTIFTSNTSSLDIDEMAAATTRPDKVMGTHFFIPVYQSKIIENSYGSHTSPETVATVMKISKKIGKIPFLVKNSEFFVVNRAMMLMNYEALLLLEEGATPHAIDEAMEGFGIPMGQFKLMDLIGLDTIHSIINEAKKRHGSSGDGKIIGRDRFPKIGDLMFVNKRLGRKTGKGWYKYETKGYKDATVDDEAMKLISEYHQQQQIIPRKHTKEEITDRCTLPLVHECFRILEEGIVESPKDIDLMSIFALGWPKTTGGPLTFAYKMGLDELISKMKYYHSKIPDGHHWEPCSLLKDLERRKLPYKEWKTGAKLLRAKL